MTATEPEASQASEARPRKSRMPLLLGLVLALIGGGGGYVAVGAGLIGGGAPEAQVDTEAPPSPLAPARFVPLDPLVVNLPPDSGRRFLRFSAQLEATPEHAAEVEAIRPRIADVLNTYLRAIEVSDLQDPAALTRLRAQMLRRVQVVAGAGRVRDLLVMEFVLD